jgi:alpha-amylase/alpha-mannosidase (GH57 family)
LERYVCIHGHFYQPPRENPWLEEVEEQESAHPYHDWNEKITAECYAPNAVSRIMDGEERVIDEVNNYCKISFNFGPTLLSWMERHSADTYRAVIDADLRSRDAFSGHGSAIAQVFNHMIMPLANEAHKRIQLKWGISDFVRRFNREPEGIWLPETAVDLKTLEACADEHVGFTILAPHQAGKVRSMDGGDWKSVAGGAINTKKPYTCRLPSGKRISIFFYDKNISHEIAFDGLLRDGKAFRNRLIEAFVNEETPQLVNVATDGETYGHHHHFGDMALAYCLHDIHSNGLAKITNYGEFLEKFPPRDEVQIIENTSWSCTHGIERWRSDCSCNTGGHTDWNQAWREPLRIAMDWLRDQLSSLYEQEASKYLNNPWKALEEYISVILNRSAQNIDFFISSHCKESLTEEQKILALKLLEMQRHCTLMYTSCGWFFDDVSGIETIQVMQYAARALQLAHELTGNDMESEYIKLLSAAPSNQPGIGNAATVFQRYAQPTSVDLLKVGAHYAILSIFDHVEAGTSKVYCYNIVNEVQDVLESGKQKLVIGRSRISSEITREQETVSFVALWLGDDNVLGGARRDMEPEPFEAMRNELLAAFKTGEANNLMIPIVNYYGGRGHSLTQLFKDNRRRITEMIHRGTLSRAPSS